MVQYRFEHVLQPLHRILFRTKIRTVHASLRSTFDLAQVETVHAHFLFSDGAVALRLKKSLNLPYVAAVRNTDLNYFMRYRPDLRALANRILDEAAHIVFLSPAYKTALLNRVGKGLRARLEPKAVIIPNGLVSHWLAAPPAGSAGRSGPLRLLYVGDFSRNKNLRNTLRAVTRLAATRAVQLTLVGGGGNAEQEVRRALDSGAYPFAKYLGRIDDPDELRTIYRDHDIFVMPSFTETFGVAYIEALSQGLPVVHSRGQGVDGLLPDSTVSEAVDPRDPENIAEKISALAERREQVREACIHSAQCFDWELIAKRYTELYRSARG
jgi:glycosyltransferase involved in cell wall biosynthesis